MAKIAKGVLGVLTGFLRNKTQWEQELLTYAQTEYRKDWRHMYEYMLAHNGKLPNTHTWR